MWNGQEEKNILAVFARYHELHPNIFIENHGGLLDDTKTIRAIVANVPPDLCTLTDPLVLGPLAANNALLPLDDLLNTETYKESDFVPASLKQCRFKGRLYAMPYLIDCTALFWNKKLFKEAGLDPERPPSTMEELQQYAKKLTKVENNEIAILGLQPLTDVMPILCVFGGRLTDPSEKNVTVNSEKMTEGMSWYLETVKAMGGYEKVNAFSSGFGQAQSANNPFFVGKVAMMVSGEWIPFWTTKYSSNLDYGVAALPPPANHPERTGTTWLGGNMFAIPRASKHVKEAKEILIWMQSEEAQTLLAKLNNNVPNQLSVLGSPELRQGEPYKKKFSVFLDLAKSKNAEYFPAIPVSGLLNGELLNARDVVLNLEKSPKQALNDTQARVQRELGRYP